MARYFNYAGHHREIRGPKFFGLVSESTGEWLFQASIFQMFQGKRVRGARTL
jgi:hypothetical protein